MKVAYQAAPISIISSVAAIASIFAAATTASTVAVVAYAILGVALGAVAIASLTAWMECNAVYNQDYFEILQRHITVAIPTALVYTATTAGQIAMNAFIERAVWGGRR